MSSFPDRTAREYILAEDGAEQHAIVGDLAGRLDLGVASIADLILQLEPYMGEHASLPDTAKALGLLCAVILRVQAPFQRVDVHELTSYFTNRLANTDQLQYRAGIQQSAEAIVALVNHDNGKKFVAGDVETVVKAIFAVDSNGLLRDIKPSGRLSLYNLLKLLMKNYRPTIAKNVGRKAFTEGLVSMAELEKDPSNLKALFEMYVELGRDWDLDEETLSRIWESYSRYFPITLQRVSTDPSVPTPSQLKNLLTKCFLSHNSYAKEVFPRLIDMLDTNQDLSANVKKDVFGTICACISGYDLSTALDWAPKIWDSVKFEIWNGENDEFISGSLRVINALATKLSSSRWDWDDESSIQAIFVIGVLKECTRRIVDSKHRYMLSTGRIIYAIVSASPYMFQWAPKKVIPSLLTLSSDLDSKSEITLLFGVVNRILQARIEVEIIMDSPDNVLPNDAPDGDISQNYLRDSKAKLVACLIPFRERLVELYWGAMSTEVSDSPTVTEFRVMTIQGLTLLMGIRDYLADMERGTIVQSLNEIVLNQDESRKIYDETVTALRQISVEDPVRFHDITLANFATNLPSSISSDHEMEYIIHVLDALMEIACTQACALLPPSGTPYTIFDDFVQTILNKLYIGIRQKAQVAYANVLLSAILRGLEMFDVAMDIKISTNDVSLDAAHHPYAWIIKSVLREFLTVKQVTNSDTVDHVSYVGLKLDLEQNEATYKFVSLVAGITTSVLRSDRTTLANNFLVLSDDIEPSRIWGLFCEGVSPEVNKTQMDLRNGPADKCLVNVFSMALIAGARREDKQLLGINVGDVALSMIRNAIHAGAECSPFARVSVLYFLQILVNKFFASKETLVTEGGITLAKFIEDIAHKASTDTNTAKVERYYQVLAYYATAALARCDPSDRVAIQQMIAGLEHPKLGRRIAQSFRMFLGPSEVLQKANFAIIRPLRQGRLYAYTIDTMISKWREATDQKIKVNYLIALVATMSHMEISVYVDNVDAIFPLLLESTNVQNDDATKLACVEKIGELIPACPHVVNSHLDSIINRMTDRTRNTYFSPSDAKVECRAAAIDVLTLLTKHVAKSDLIKRKVKVLSELDIALDDGSVLVRERAQRCKLAWFKQVSLVDPAGA